MVKDVVCNNDVNEKTAKWKITNNGKAYYFCSQECLKAFEEEPELYNKSSQEDLCGHNHPH
jgi:YHS domain-containing protein